MPNDDFEKQLAAIDWSRVSHAYGPADDVPDLLRAVADGTRGERKKAFHTLYGNIFHQGTRYPASAKAATCLIELLRRNKQPDLVEILVLLNHLAVGYQESFLETGFDFTDREVKKAWGRNAFGRSYVAVREGSDVYLDLLEHDDAQVRGAAAFLLAFLRETAATTVPRLQTRIATESNAIAQGSMLIAIGMLSMVAKEDVDLAIFHKPISNSAKSRHKRLLRSSAAIGLSYCEPREVDDNVMAVLEAATSDSELTDTKLPWNNGNLASLAGIMIGRVGQQSGQDVLPGLLAALKAAKDGNAGSQAAETLLGHCFEPRELPRRIPTELTAQQMGVLRAIHDADKAHRFGNMNSMLEAYGLPWPRDLFSVFLGLSNPGLPGTLLELHREGSAEKQPAWVWNQMTVDGLLAEDELAAAIADQLTVDDAVALCVGPIEDVSTTMSCTATLCLLVFDRLGKRCRPALTRRAKEILAADAWMEESRLSISVALARFALAGNSKVPPIVDELMQKVIPGSPASEERLNFCLAEEVLLALPDDRRLKLITSKHHPCWKLFRLVSPRDIFDHATRFMQWPNEHGKDFLRWVTSEDLQIVIDIAPSTSAEFRQLVADILGEHQTEQSAKALFDLLDDSSKRVRRAAIESLSSFPAAMLSDGIAESLKSRRKHRRDAAQQLLDRQSRPATGDPCR